MPDYYYPGGWVEIITLGIYYLLHNRAISISEVWSVQVLHNQGGRGDPKFEYEVERA